jgi:Glycosyl hydrolases family 39
MEAGNETAGPSAGRPMRRLTGYRLAPILAVILLGGVAGSPQIYAGPDHPIPAQYFGMHIHRAAGGTPWPAVPFASWRLWDSGVAWAQLEPQRDKWNFELLDRYVKLAAEHEVEIVLTLGLTPSWASARPDEPSAYQPGNAAEPRDLADWRNYVHTVAVRYQGVVRSYEIWNEPNVRGTFTGTPAAMLRLSRVAYEALKAVDPGITVVSPSATANAGVAWLGKFLKAGGCQYSDVIGYHFYVTPEAPEAMIPLIQQVRKVLRSKPCGNRPLWNTESGWAAPRHFSSDAEAAGYLMRAYVVNWLMGIDRFYWYAWDNHNWSTLGTTARSGDEKTPAGNAYGVIHDWLVGSVLRSCRLQNSTVWVCQLELGRDKSWIVWSPANTQSFSPPQSWRIKTVSTWTGQSSVPGPTLQVGSTPIRLSDSAQ